MGFITAAIVGGLVLGAVSVQDARKSRRSQEKSMDKQERQARNLARTPTVLEDTGADIQVGTDGETGDRQASSGPRSTRKPKREVGTGTVGGLFRNNMSGTVGGLFRNTMSGGLR